MDRFTGGCLCGDVRIAASGRPYRVGICHCLDCRKHHGALFHASAVFPQDAVTIDGEARGDGAELAREMAQSAIVACALDERWAGRRPSFAFVREGPYAIPVRR